MPGPPLSKAIYVARFREGMAREEARRHWTEVHGPMADDLEHLVRYIQSHVVAGLGDADLAAVGFDGYACEWWTDRTSFDAGMRTAAWKRIVDDGAEVFDAGSLDRASVLAHERIVREGPLGAFKLACFVRFGDGVDREAADEHWRRAHATLACRLPGLGRYVQNLAIGTIGDGGAVTQAPARFDGLAEMWFEDRAAFERASASEEWDALQSDRFEFLDMADGASMAGVVEERVIKPHPRA